MTSQLLKLLAILLTLFFLVMGFITLTEKRAGTIAGAQPSPTVAATATPSPTTTVARTLSPTATATHATATPSPTPSTTPTAIPTHTPAATRAVTATPTITATDTPSATDVASTDDAPTATTTPSPTETPSGPPTDTPTPTNTPTPVPRTVRADDVPDYTQATPHLWFTRPFTDAFATWGSWYYPYGTNNNGEYLWHRGVDIQNEEGTPIIAVGDGLVVFAGQDTTRAVGPQTNFYGQAVVIQHSHAITTVAHPDEKLPVYTLYGHVSKVLVQEGETVQAGQPIALVGQEGVALGPHLHLEVRLGENSYLATQNPDLWVRPDPGYGIIAGRVVDADGFYVPQQLITLHRAATPAKFWRQTWTYPDHRYTFDPDLGETFTFADVKAGEYMVKTSFDGHNFSMPVTVRDGEVSFVLIEGQSAPPAPPSETSTPSP